MWVRAGLFGCHVATGLWMKPEESSATSIWSLLRTRPDPDPEGGRDSAEIRRPVIKSTAHSSAPPYRTSGLNKLRHLSKHKSQKRSSCQSFDHFPPQAVVHCFIDFFSLWLPCITAGELITSFTRLVSKPVPLVIAEWAVHNGAWADEWTGEVDWAPSQYKDCLIYVWRFPC